MKLSVYAMMLCMLGLYGVFYVSPAIFLSALFSILTMIFPASEYPHSPMPIVIWLAYVIFYVYFTASHYRKVFVGWMFYIAMLMSMVTVVASSVGVVKYAKSEYIRNPTPHHICPCMSQQTPRRFTTVMQFPTMLY